ncbi:HAMP domain-containing sensor histidine kinase [Herbiconiux sp. KACC 21604]|uniref:sensor histidine kinase n=1 Tax=unclassified Herbiconiux TaxID=2618217 RepID=UPI00149278C7|nr:HAMP domain-containing sensor histidine kinase [Herbiconiux sp. SALV-R1]QJU53475.1 HAMP domain-containing histidine kinase [Herbiconiux sp. SALV-R1]WPO88449.1 HAMP domain-containing sensor histidine kinase [Herbiconiux sp. KACC 21604]
MTAEDLALRRTARRLALQFSAVIAVIIAVVGVLAYALVSASVAESTDRALSISGQDLRGDEAPADTWVITVRSGRAQSSKPLPEGLPDTAALERVQQGAQVVDSTVSADGRSYAVRTRLDENTLVQVAIDQHESNEELGRLAWSLVGAGAVGVVAAAAGGYLLSRRAMRPLTDALAKQRRFVADASHELRTPLTLLSTRVQLLRRRIQGDTSPARLQSEADAVVADAAGLTAILEDLLIAADDRPASVGAVDVSAIAREVVTAAGAEAEAAGIELTLHTSAAAVAAAAEAPLRRVLFSLISNALDHARSSVTVEVGQEAKTVRIRVADDGQGFRDGDRPFERFASDRTPGAGPAHYGLGLALVADVVNRYGGSARVVKELPGGVVEATLPRP